MVGDAIGALFCCAAIPFALVAIAVAIGEGIYRATAMRGIEPGRYHCGRCRYNVHGIGSWNCPECGSDLRRVGLRTRKDQPRFSICGRILLWSAAMLPIAVVICGMAMALLPNMSERTFSVSLVDVDSHGLMRPIHVIARGVGWGKSPRLESVKAYAVYADGSYHSLADYAVDDKSWHRPEPWFAALEPHGIGADGATREAYADDLARLAAALAQQRTDLTPLSRLSVRVDVDYSDQSTGEYKALVGLVMSGVVWVAVLVWITRVWSRQNKERLRLRKRTIEEFGRIAGMAEA